MSGERRTPAIATLIDGALVAIGIAVVNRLFGWSADPGIWLASVALYRTYRMETRHD